MVRGGGGSEHGFILWSSFLFFQGFDYHYLVIVEALNLWESKMNNSTGFNGKQNQLQEEESILA